LQANNIVTRTERAKRFFIKHLGDMTKV